jgi:hypothetical protein
VKYLLLIYESPGTREHFQSEDGEGLMAGVLEIMKEITDSGELVTTAGLADPSTAKSVRTIGGAPAVTDGPFAEAKEHLGGYVIVECDERRALEIAERWPVIGTGGLEVRPLMDAGGTEM